MSDREERIGYWVSGTAHIALILWALIGGVLLRPQPSQPVRMTEVATMSGSEFEELAAASRGAGPIDDEAAQIDGIEQPVVEPDAGIAPSETEIPEVQEEAQELAAPEEAESEPDLSDFEPQEPVNVATALPDAPSIPKIDERDPVAPSGTELPEAAEQPARPAAPDQELAAEPAEPRSPLALDISPRPQDRPDGLVEQYNQRLAAEEAARQAAQQAAADAARQAAEAEAAAQAEAARAEQERQEAEAAARAEQERQAAEEQAAKERRAAEAAAREEAERQAAAQAAREEEERRAEQERQEAAEREAADRQALQDALREAQENAEGEQSASTDATGDQIGDNTQRIEGGSDASVEQDPLSAALSEAMSSAVPPPSEEVEDEITPDQNQLVPQPIIPEPLPDPEEQSAVDSETNGAAPLGQPLSLSERETFRVALERCWNRAALSVEASGLNVSVRFQLGPDGRPDMNSPELIEASAASSAAVRNAYEVARRAILQCGLTGFPLPPEKYGRWREVIVDFHPEGVEF